MERGRKASCAPRGKGGLGKKSHSLFSLLPLLSSPPLHPSLYGSRVPADTPRTFSPGLGGALARRGRDSGLKRKAHLRIGGVGIIREHRTPEHHCEVRGVTQCMEKEGKK